MESGARTRSRKLLVSPYLLALPPFAVVPNKMAIIDLDGNCSFASATWSDRGPVVGHYSSGGLLNPVRNNHGSEKLLHGNSSIYCSAGQDAIVLVAKRHHELCQNNTPHYRRRS